MENFLFALNTVLPFLLYIAFGYGVRMSGLADEDFMKRLNKVIFQAFFPILMFNNLYSIPEGMTLNLRLVAVAIISVLLLQAVLLAVVPRLVKENERRGVIIQAIYRSNFVLFGIPLATSVFGEEGTLLATMMVAIVIPVYNITAVVILELFRGGKVPVFVLIKNILKNPMIRGALMGFIFRIKEVHLVDGGMYDAPLPDFRLPGCLPARKPVCHINGYCYRTIRLRIRIHSLHALYDVLLRR